MTSGNGEKVPPLNGELKRTARARRPYPRYDRQPTEWLLWAPVWQWAYNPGFCRALWREISVAARNVTRRAYAARTLRDAYVALCVQHNRKTGGRKKGEGRFTLFAYFNRDMLAEMCWLSRGHASEVYRLLIASGVIEADPGDSRLFRPRLMSQAAPALLNYLQLHRTFPELDWWRDQDETKPTKTTKTNESAPQATAPAHPRVNAVVRESAGGCPGCEQSWEVLDGEQPYPTHTGRVRLCSECHSDCETRTGPCRICDEPLPAEVQAAILAKRAEGYAVLWNHYSVEGFGCA